ncbi:glycosylphosphatidylinositol anchor biosynthesis [Colletotrichum fioriniae]|uniref:glycosylphosphatidylinositol anchor biosynthesis n=1 Tax=Colletotrichum fioriniae TaxID=710243 RepID=UPI0032DB3F6D|nr:glycosylphosphatidylinositol anchor biosynthesis [Colletotrichum fioriniae]
MAVRNEHNKPSVFRSLLIIRLLNAWWVLTFFQPDEYFQALEPAWRMAFGEGSGAWITWEWRNQLRSSLHPALFAGVYTLADLVARPLPIIRPWLLLAAPKAAQAVFAAAGDWYTWQLAVKIYGADSSVSWFALFMSMFSPFQWYCSTRTFSNSLETTLTIMALNYWPWELLVSAYPSSSPQQQSSSAQQTSSFGYQSPSQPSSGPSSPAPTQSPPPPLVPAPVPAPAPPPSSPPQTILLLLREALLCGTLVLSLSLTSDRLYFGEWAFPPYKFLYFNLSQSLAVLYGRNDWHYYLSQGLPLLSMTYLPSSSYPSTTPRNRQLDHARKFPAKRPSKPSPGQSTSHSPPSPPSPTKKSASSTPPPNPPHPRRRTPSILLHHPGPATLPRSPLPKPRLRRKRLLASALGLHAAIAFFLTLLHQPAPPDGPDLPPDLVRPHTPGAGGYSGPDRVPGFGVDVLLFLFFILLLLFCFLLVVIISNNIINIDSRGRQRQRTLRPLPNTMPLHPWRSHLLHPSLRARALTCEPPLHTQPDTPEREAYRDEADRFYDDPQRFMATELWPAAASRSRSRSRSSSDSDSSDSDSESAAPTASVPPPPPPPPPEEAEAEAEAEEIPPLHHRLRRHRTLAPRLLHLPPRRRPPPRREPETRLVRLEWLLQRGRPSAREARRLGYGAVYYCILKYKEKVKQH